MASTTKVIGSKPSDCFQFQAPNTWICVTELESDVVIEVGGVSFHLHKLPLINRSATLKNLINDEATDGDDDDGRKQCTIQMDDIPGGPEAFELAARFCYDVQLELTAANVVPLRCAAEHLGMAGAVHQTESFLSEALRNWNDAVRALHACDAALPLAEDLLVVQRCVDALASKACADPTLFGWPMLHYYTAAARKGLDEETVVWNGIATPGKPRSPGADWWYKEASSFRLPVYKRLIVAMKSRGMGPASIAGSLAHYARRHISGLLGRHGGKSRAAAAAALSDGEQRAVLEEVVALLPEEAGVAATRFLLGLLRTATVLHASAACRDALERRAGSQLDDAALEDLLIPNVGYAAETLYDVDCVHRMLDQFVMESTASAASPEIITTDEGGQLVDAAASAELRPVTTVAKLVDGYLAEVGTDPNLKLSKFHAIAALVPDYARALDDGLYRAIDIYLKAHPWLTDSEREQLCRLINCQKLSLEACTHAAQNERLPLRVVVQVLFFEQLRLRTTVAGWFYVADNVDRGSSSSDHWRRQSSSDLDFAPQASSEDEEEAEAARHAELSSAMSVEEIRQRVSELESECSSMRQEIHRLGKPKGALSRLFQKLGFGGRSSSSRQRQQQLLRSSSTDKRRNSVDLGC
ncbi:hypothetical protein PR202_ga18872 [Eleusine coracana subsp. coracana]|uniref:BTB/POZ domain-containing protein n=1 Tax=Eleusine coracana subsp. coracana TaxID=191504 RepID=A0AAV5CTS2_ELECO|nr:hypothetical protein PR202_ga18872 [Eleusine coracana subsp. coracana]